MTDAHESSRATAEESVQPSAADSVVDPTMAPMDDAAGGPTADRDEEEPSAEEAAAQLGDFA